MAQAPKTPAAPATPAIQFQYIDRPELAEVFADFVSRVQFDGQTMRFEFCVSRVDDQPGGRRHGQALSVVPACAPAIGRDRSHEQDAADHRDADQGRRAEAADAGAGGREDA